MGVLLKRCPNPFELKGVLLKLWNSNYIHEISQKISLPLDYNINPLKLAFWFIAIWLEIPKIVQNWFNRLSSQETDQFKSSLDASSKRFFVDNWDWYLIAIC